MADTKQEIIRKELSEIITERVWHRVGEREDELGVDLDLDWNDIEYELGEDIFRYLTEQTRRKIKKDNKEEE